MENEERREQLITYMREQMYDVNPKTRERIIARIVARVDDVLFNKYK